MKILLVLASHDTLGHPGSKTSFWLEEFAAPYDVFRDAIDACLRDGLIREPIRLPEGALQCHWRLELTPNGVAEVRRLGLIGLDH